MGFGHISSLRFEDRIPVEARLSPPVHPGNGAHPAYCTMGTGSIKERVELYLYIPSEPSRPVLEWILSLSFYSNIVADFTWYGGGLRCAQAFGGVAWGNETIGETQT
jgi:hypothetical protein